MAKGRMMDARLKMSGMTSENGFPLTALRNDKDAEIDPRLKMSRMTEEREG
jgi:hypothetical protein